MTSQNDKNTIDHDASASIQIVCDLHEELASALNSLGGKDPDHSGQNFLFYFSSFINRCVDAYVLLRKAGRIDAAKILIRPTIEAMIRIESVRAKPELTYRLCVNDRVQHRKWLRPIAEAHGEGDKYDRDKAVEWDNFTKKYAADYPTHPLLDKEIDLRCAAEAAGLERYYDTHYRLYSKFTHAALGALIDYYNDLEHADNRSMSLCAFSAVQALISLGASAPNIETLHKRMNAERDSQIVR